MAMQSLEAGRRPWPGVSTTAVGPGAALFNSASRGEREDSGVGRALSAGLALPRQPEMEPTG
jgi:hypothetical protein